MSDHVPGQFDLAHISDTHIAFTQYEATVPASGRNQREQDVLRAFANVIGDVLAYDPPLVIHSGDVAEKPAITWRQQLQIQKGIRDLTVRRDGSPRLVIVISGNHDMPRDPREPCYLEPALRPVASAVVVTNSYQAVHLAPYVDRGLAHESLRNVVVHCLPHDQLKRDSWEEIVPIPGKTNILTSHGVVGGSELYKRSLGREYSLPIDVLVRGWDYVALGHFHKRGPVAVGGLTAASTPIWYAGSTENCGFSDIRDTDGGRGYLRVQVRPGQVPTVATRDLPIRAMFRLPAIDAEGLGFEEIGRLMTDNVRRADLSGAVVAQRILNVARDTWSLVDVAAVRRAAVDALWYDPAPTFTRAYADGSESGGEQIDRLGDVGKVLEEVALAQLSDPVERADVLTLARRLLGSAFDMVAEADTTGPDGSPDPISGTDPAGPAADPHAGHDHAGHDHAGHDHAAAA